MKSIIDNNLKKKLFQSFDIVLWSSHTYFCNIGVKIFKSQFNREYLWRHLIKTVKHVATRTSCIKTFALWKSWSSRFDFKNLSQNLIFIEMYAKSIPKDQSTISDEKFFSFSDKVRKKIYLFIICLEN